MLFYTVPELLSTVVKMTFVLTKHISEVKRIRSCRLSIAR